MLITKNSYAPVIDIKTYIDEKGSKNITGSVLGGKAANFKWEIVTFLDFIFADYSDIKNPTSEVVQIPMEDYYLGFVQSPEKNGQTIIWDSTSNYKIICDLQDDIALKYSNIDGLSTTRVHSYIRGTYLNILGEEESVYYSITDRLGVHEDLYIALMSQKDGEDIFEQYGVLHDKNLCLYPWIDYALTAENVFDKMTEIRNLKSDLQS